MSQIVLAKLMEPKEEGHDVTIGLGLAIVNLLVVCGNVFVLYVLVSQKSLHTSTNSIVFSLTLSDFLLGVIILPFSILQEYSTTWMFGEVWCKTWLALDVLLSTASIYNLLAISFDRYMAVRQPIKYRFISSDRMTKITIAVVWLIASLLAFPPLVYDHFGVTPTSTPGSRGGQCTPATSNDWYILFSAFVSFILPMFLMAGLNFSIFYTVSDSAQLTRLPTSNKSSFMINNNSSIAAVSCDNVNNPSMRIHRGGTFNSGLQKNSTYGVLSQSQRSLNQLKRVALVQRDYHSVERNPSICSSRKQTMDSMVVAGSVTGSTIINNMSMHGDRLHSLERGDTFSTSLESPASNDCVYHNGFLQRHPSTLSEAKAKWLARLKAINQEKRQKLIEAEGHSFQSTASSLDYTHRYYPLNSSPPIIVTGSEDECPVTADNTNGDNTPTSITTSASAPTPCLKTLPFRQMSMATGDQCQPSAISKSMSIIEKSAARDVWYPAVITSLFAGVNNNNNSNTNASGNGRKTTVSSYCRKQSERLLLYPVFQHTFSRSVSMRTELRVARTIGVVVFSFTVCWLPFTIIYVLQAFQTCPVGSCIPQWFFTLAFWLGYSNSALNPLLYSACSRDFRTAFKKVLMDRGSSFRSY